MDLDITLSHVEVFHILPLNISHLYPVLQPVTKTSIEDGYQWLDDVKKLLVKMENGSLGLRTMPASQNHLQIHHLNRTCCHCLWSLPPVQLWLGMQWKFSFPQASIWKLIRPLLWLRIKQFFLWPSNSNGKFLKLILVKILTLYFTVMVYLI